jgi:sortase (surface protein transpeptidase)
MSRLSKKAVAAIGAATAAVATITIIVALPANDPQPLAAPPISTASSASAPPPPAAETSTLPASKPVSLEVPSIGVRTGKLMDLGLNPDDSLEVPPDAVTAGWFTQAPTPGEVGPSVIAGHVDYHRVPGVFVRLRDLKAGAEAIVHRTDGTSAVFTIYRVDHYPKSSFPTDKVYGDTAEPELRLITCGGDFDQAARQYTDNVVAYGKLARALKG